MNPDTQSTTNIGTLGENFVAEWLRSQGAIVLAQQWTCRSGELDLVIKTNDAIVAFVEVKTRSRGNWDSDGLLAVTPQKQQKLLIAAQLFLLKHPHLAEFPCRFDVALVRHSKQKRGNRSIPSHLTSFKLQDYIQGAFC